MAQEPKPSSPGAGRAGPDPLVIAPAGEIKNKPDPQAAELINFSPTMANEANLSVGKSDAAILRRRATMRWVAALGSLTLFAAVLFLGPGLYRDFKSWRAAVLALKGEQLVQKNQIEEAIVTIHSAFMLSPDSPEVLRAMAQILTALNVPDAMAYWNWLLETKDATDDDRRAAAECAMQNDFYEEASHIIRDLLLRNDKDARNELLAARWAVQRGTPAQTMHFATRAVEDDPTYPPAVLFLAVQELGNPYLHQKGIDSLFNLAGSNDSDGLKALHYLSFDATLKPDEIDRVIARLHSHPLAGEFERIAAMTLEIKRHPGQKEALISQAIAAHQNAAPADIATFIEWLNSHGGAARVLKFISRERALSNPDIFSAYIDALGSLQRWADLKEMLTGITVPLDASLVEVYLSRCSAETGDDEGAELHWQKAVASAAYDPAESLHLALYAEKFGQNERAAAIYRTLTQDPLIDRIAYLGLLRVLDGQDTRTLRNILDQMVARWPRDRDIASQDIYYNLLLNDRVQDMHQRAASILADDPYSVSHRTNAALACLRSNDPAGAFHVYSGVTIDWRRVSPPDLVIYAATLNANGNAAAARRLLVSVDRNALCPELRDLIKSI
ncbi:MAG TPA: hypothetical protein VL981_13185 [Candidatus Methylacidiphilales bacterium]|nr:hypothetical protein [Candidatus Methylacidiphilales bacterium]